VRFANLLPFMLIVIFLLLMLSRSVFALPIDWHGAFGVDTTRIQDYRMIKSEGSSAANPLSQEVDATPGSSNHASFQSYLFRLNPELIVNDAVSIKGEITSGYGRGGYLGDNSVTSKENKTANALYALNTTDGGNANLAITKLYAELYSETATYIIGRQTFNWGLGAVYNDGHNLWDRHTFIRDGITAKVKVGNFDIAPYWAKVSSKGSLARATSVSEYGVALSYDNYDNDIGFGVLYAKKDSGPNTATTAMSYDTNGNGTYSAMGSTDVKIIDVYLQKKYKGLSFSVEFPYMNGDIGDVYEDGAKNNYKAYALITETTLKLNDSWKIGINAGTVTGDDGKSGKFEAMYLHPNFKIANLMMTYNLNAINDPENKSLYDSYLTNLMYAKLFANYESNKWKTHLALIYGKANQVAKAGEKAFNHQKDQYGTATYSQSDKLGYELDANFDYLWNSNLSIGTQLGAYFAGDYYAYTNSATPNAVKNSYLVQFRMGINF